MGAIQLLCNTIWPYRIIIEQISYRSIKKIESSVQAFLAYHVLLKHLNDKVWLGLANHPSPPKKNKVKAKFLSMLNTFELCLVWLGVVI